MNKIKYKNITITSFCDAPNDRQTPIEGQLYINKNDISRGDSPDVFVTCKLPGATYVQYLDFTSLKFRFSTMNGDNYVGYTESESSALEAIHKLIDQKLPPFNH